MAPDIFYTQALKLLSKRDYTVTQLREKLEAKYGPVPGDVIERLIQKRFLNDRRFAENYVLKRKNKGSAQVRHELIAKGVSPQIADDILSATDWPSLKHALKAKMDDWNLRAPLHSRDAARLFRALVRLGYEEDAIREEVEQLHHEQ